MIDPNHKAASSVGFFGTALTAFLDFIGKVDWAHITGFVTFILVLSQLFWGWDKWRKSK
jgi:hypothetical protein